MRDLRSALLLVAIVSGCGGGGGSSQPAAISFGTVAADAPTVREVDVANPVGASTVEAVAATGPFRVADGELPTPAQGDLALRIRFDPPGPGEFQGTVTVRFVPAGGGDPAEVTVALRATAEAARPSSLTTSLDFGEVPATGRATRRLTLVNGAQRTACNVGAPSMPAAFSIPGTLFPLRIAAQETAAIDVEYAPLALGIPAFDLVFPHDGDGASLRVPVTATTSTWPEEMVIDLGDVDLDANGDTPWLEVDVPPHAISLTVEATATADDMIDLLALEWPGGYSAPMPPYGLQWPTVKRGIRSVTVPWTNAPAQQLAPGGGIYRFRFRRESGPATSLKVRALIESRPGGVVSGGVVDLNVFVRAASGIAPEQIPLWAAATVAAADGIFAPIGLKIGDVKGYVLDTAFDPQITSNDPGRLYELFAESGKAADVRLNAFVVWIDIPGVAGMVQGPASNGWAESGLAVNGFGNGKLLAHEIGHYLGLHHAPGDAITDTNGGDNLMTTGTVITPGQAHVILRHPLVRSP